MFCIHIENNNPFFCLAAEEYFLKNFSEDIFLIWQSTDTVVVGKHQNTLAEINYPFVIKYNIKVARRISGGGAVFHDSGNVNFTFIKNIKDPAEINFNIFTRPVIDSLSKLNLKVIPSGHNDLLINEKKISGNAEHIHKNRVLHHGTLLFNSNLKNLRKVLTSKNDKYQDKAVKSRPGIVSNIAPFLNNNWSVNDFTTFLINDQLKNPESSLYKLTKKDHIEIQELVKEKFMTWNWNYGYSPKYSFNNLTVIEGKRLIIKLKTEKGLINKITVSGNFFSDEESSLLINILKDKKHNYEDIRQSLEKIKHNASDELVFSFF